MVGSRKTLLSLDRVVAVAFALVVLAYYAQQIVYLDVSLDRYAAVVFLCVASAATLVARKASLGKQSVLPYLYVALCFASAVWSVSPANTLHAAAIQALYLVTFYCFLAGKTIEFRGRLFERLAVVGGVLGLGIMSYWLSLYGTTRTGELESNVGLHLTYVGYLLLPFALARSLKGPPEGARCRVNKDPGSVGRYHSASGLLTGVTIGCLMLVNLMSGSRLAMVACVAAPVLFYSLFFGARLRVVMLGLGALGVAASAGVVTYSIAPDVVGEAVARISQLMTVGELLFDQGVSVADLKQYSEFARVLNYTGAVDIVSDYPLLGIGFKMAPQVMEAYVQEQYAYTVHNMVLGSQVELGVAGTMIMFLLIGQGIFKGMSQLANAHNREERAYAAAAVTAFVFVVLAGLLNPIYHNWMFFAALGLVLVKRHKGGSHPHHL